MPSIGELASQLAALANTPPGSGVTVHADLTGMDADDHTQYHNDTRGDARYSQLGHTHSGSDAFPVGSVFIGVVSTSPATLLGYGTWSAFGAGRVLIGIDSGDANFDTVLETGGAKTVAAAGTVSAPTVDDHASHTHTYTQVPNHVHASSTLFRSATTGTATTQIATALDATSTATTLFKTDNPDGGVATGTTAGPSATLTHTVGTPTFTGSATSVVQPYIVVYMWQRTA